MEILASDGFKDRYPADQPEFFRRQTFYFSILNLLLVGALFALQVISKSVRGRPSEAVIIVLAIGFVLQSCHLGWVLRQGDREVSSADRSSAFWFIFFNSSLSLVLTFITIRGDTAYYALMLVPILQAAFILNFSSTLSVVAFAVFISFLGAYGMKFGEYIEAGAMSTIYAVMAILVWLLTNNLRSREAKFLSNLEDLQQAREQLLSEEKLAAVGRLSRALAHEIRNPVAMISSSLATATRLGQDEAERQEMFEIAAKEAARLERLTADFLAYARTPTPRFERVNVADTLGYVASVSRAHATNRGVALEVIADRHLEAEFDPTEIQQALLNLVLNAIDACSPGQIVRLQGESNGPDRIRLNVIDPAGPISTDVTSRIFEPLFTTKAEGSGLGLAIARNLARANNGDLRLERNDRGHVCFSIEVPEHSTQSVRTGEP